MILYILWRKYTSHIAFHTSSTCSMLFNDLVNDLKNYEISKLWLSTTYCYTIASQGKLFINTAHNLLALPYSIEAQTLLVPVDHKKIVEHVSFVELLFPSCPTDRNETGHFPNQECVHSLAPFSYLTKESGYKGGIKLYLK